jgi:hypothetical protein
MFEDKQLFDKVMEKLTSPNASVYKTFTPGGKYTVGVRNYYVGSLEIQSYNSLIKIVYDGIELGILRGEYEDKIVSKLWDLKKKSKDEALNKFFKS